MIWGYLLALIIALIIVRLTHQYAEMRNCQLSGYVFVALFMASLFAHPFGRGHVVTLLILLSYFPLFSSFEVRNPSVSIFVTFLLLGLAALVYPPMKWLVPIYWIGMILIRAFCVKSFVASLFGIILPWLWILALKSADVYIPYFHSCFSIKLPIGGYSAMTSYKWIMAVCMGVMFLYGTGVFRHVTFFAKSKTRMIFRVITLQSVASLLLMFISPKGFEVWYMVVLLNVSLILSRMIDRKL